METQTKLQPMTYMNWQQYARIKCHQRHFYWLVSRSQHQSHCEMVNPRFLILLEFRFLYNHQHHLVTAQCSLLAAFHVCQNYNRPVAPASSSSMDADWSGHISTHSKRFRFSCFHVFMFLTSDCRWITYFFFTLWWYTWHNIHSLFGCILNPVKKKKTHTHIHTITIQAILMSFGLWFWLYKSRLGSLCRWLGSGTLFLNISFLLFHLAPSGWWSQHINISGTDINLENSGTAEAVI